MKFLIKVGLAAMFFVAFSVGANFAFEEGIIPDDPYFQHQLWLHRMNAPQAWTITTGSRDVVVAVFDQGIDTINHLDLRGQIDVSLSRDFVRGDPSTDFLFLANGNPASPFETNSLFTNRYDFHADHGSPVAAIIGARSDDGFGVAGLNWNIRIAGFQAADINSGALPAGSRNTVSGGDIVMYAIQFAIDNDIPIIQSSMQEPLSPALRAALAQYSGLFVRAAGNGNQDLNFPVGGHGIPNLITVGTSHPIYDTRWESSPTFGSNYCRNGVDIFAPTENIFTARRTHPAQFPNCPFNNLFTPPAARVSGTSFASPAIAGVAALMLSVNPNLTGAELRTMIMETAERVPTLMNYSVAGLVDAYAAVKAARDAAGGTSIRPSRDTQQRRYGILLENAVVSDVARISVITPEPATVNLRIFDALGNVVWAADGVGAGFARPENRTNGDLGGQTPPLQNAIVWDLRNSAGRFVASGTYLIMVEATAQNGRIYRYVAPIGVRR